MFLGLATLSFPQSASAIGISIYRPDDTSNTSIAQSGGSGAFDQNTYSSSGWLDSTLITNGLSFASADWSFENSDSHAVFAGTNMLAGAGEVGQLGAAWNHANVYFELTEAVNYTVVGSFSGSKTLGATPDRPDVPLQQVSQLFARIRRDTNPGSSHVASYVDEDAFTDGSFLHSFQDGSSTGILQAGKYVYSGGIQTQGFGRSTGSANLSLVLTSVKVADSGTTLFLLALALAGLISRRHFPRE